MKNLTFFVIAAVILSGCTHSIIRTGYEVKKSDYRSCDIVIKKSITNTDSLKKVGEIKLGDSGFSVTCSEADAIEILKREGCALGADLINITEENRPNLWSYCYRCKAEFYTFTGTTIIAQSDETYKSENINQRTSKESSKNTAIAIGSVMIGFLFGYFLFQ